MERGPVALFGAIVAVGLGPALWLGVQFGGVEQQPPINHQPAVIQQKPAGTELFGGSGAGQETSTPEDHEVRTTPHRNADPVTRTPRRHTPSPSPSAEPEPSKPSSPTTTDPSDPASHPAGEDPSGPSNGDSSAPPDPPTNGDGNTGGGNTGGGNTGGGNTGDGTTGNGNHGEEDQEQGSNSIVAAPHY